MKWFAVTMAVLIVGLVGAGVWMNGPGLVVEESPLPPLIRGEEEGMVTVLAVTMGVVMGAALPLGVGLVLVVRKRGELARVRKDLEARAERAQAVMPARRVDPVERLVELMTLEVMGRMGTDHERHEKHERIDAPGEMARLDEEVWHG